MISDHEILHAMTGAMRYLSPDARGGAHTEVFVFEPEALGSILADLATRHDAPIPRREAARRLGRDIGERFLLKVGNVDYFVMKLSGGAEESFIRRDLLSEVFGPVGYNFAPTTDKVSDDVSGAVREIPYFASGSPADQFAPDLLGEIRHLVTGEDPGPTAPDAAVFLVEERGSRRLRRTVYEVLREDPYFEGRINGFEDLQRFQGFLRANPLSSELKSRMQPFFEAPITVGMRDVLRYSQGSRHPTVGWQHATEIASRAFEEHGNENFLPPEINYYTHAIAHSPEDVADSARHNREAARAFADLLIARLPFGWTASCSDDDLMDVAAALLDAHFDYPRYAIEPYSGIASQASLRMALRLACGFGVHLSKMNVPVRRNPVGPQVAARHEVVARLLAPRSDGERHRFFVIANQILWEMALRGGIARPDGDPIAYRPLQRTFYSFQEKAQYPIAARGVVDQVLTLEDLLTPAGDLVLQQRPDIAQKLVVFFTLVYRYFLETDHVVDLRPDNVGRDLFLKGIWGYSTRNVLVTLGHDRNGTPIHAIRFVDNKDQFKQYNRAEDRSHPVGLAKHGLRLLHTLVQPSMERSIGLYVQKVADLEGLSSTTAAPGPGRGARVTQHVVREGVDGLLVYLGAFLRDLVDDTIDGIGRRIKPR